MSDRPMSSIENSAVNRPTAVASSSLVEAVAVGRSFQRGGVSVVALANATCQIVPGDRIALMGPSGSGKSTLLHLMGGLDTPTSGTISWPLLGKREDLRPGKVGFIFQSASLLAPLSVVENVELPLLLGRAAGAAARAAAQDALERLGLWGLRDQLPEELSGGQAQRVAMARALTEHPRVIFADEPTGQLDHPTAQRLFDTLLAALSGTPTALVVATHDPAIADRLDRVWHIQRGILEVTT